MERSFNVRFLKQLDFAQFWGNVDDRSALSSDPEHKLKAETDAGTARSDADVETEKNREDAAIYAKIHAIPSTEFAKYTEEEIRQAFRRWLILEKKIIRRFLPKSANCRTDRSCHQQQMQNRPQQPLKK